MITLLFKTRVPFVDGVLHDEDVLLLKNASTVPSVGDTVDIAATIYSVAARHFLYAEDGDAVVTCWLANVDGMVGYLMRASQ